MGDEADVFAVLAQGEVGDVGAVVCYVACVDPVESGVLSVLQSGQMWQVVEPVASERSTYLSRSEMTVVFPEPEEVHIS